MYLLCVFDWIIQLSIEKVLTEGGVVDSGGTEAGGIMPNGWLETGILNCSNNGKNIIDCRFGRFNPFIPY